LLDQSIFAGTVSELAFVLTEHEIRFVISIIVRRNPNIEDDSDFPEVRMAFGIPDISHNPVHRKIASALGSMSLIFAARICHGIRAQEVGHVNPTVRQTLAGFAGRDSACFMRASWTEA
jgi:hypothetical protein